MMPTYDDPDYEWKQMIKKNGICDPYEKSIREFKEEYERIEKKLKQTGGWNKGNRVFETEKDMISVTNLENSVTGE